MCVRKGKRERSREGEGQDWMTLTVAVTRSIYLSTECACYGICIVQ